MAPAMRARSSRGGSTRAACWCASPARALPRPTTTPFRGNCAAAALRPAAGRHGGALWGEQPQQLAAFARESPFNGMAVPNDVTVTRQVLAEPDSGLTERTWATLGDGTPLVTAARRGKGFIVLFHVTADTRWSDLPISGAFVDMLKRIVALSGSTAT